MYVMAKEVTLCISIHKENSLWHGLGMVSQSFPAVGKANFATPRAGSWAFRYIFLGFLSSGWEKRDSSEKQQWLQARTPVRWDGTFCLSFMCLPLGKPEHQVNVHSWFSRGMESYGARPVPSSVHRRAFLGSTPITYIWIRLLLQIIFLSLSINQREIRAWTDNTESARLGFFCKCRITTTMLHFLRIDKPRFRPYS